MIEGSPLEMHLSQRAQISSIAAETVTLPKNYKNFKDVFSVENAGHLPLYKDHYHAIHPVDGK